MGADLLFISLGARITKRLKNGDSKDDMEARLDATLAKVDAWGSLEDVPEMVIDDISEGEGKEGTTLADIQERLRADIKDIRESVSDGARDVSTIGGGGDTLLYVTGGMSWGDAPCDSYSVFSRVCEVFPDARDEAAVPVAAPSPGGKGKGGKKTPVLKIRA
jgi:hypothetical protein